MAEQKGACPYAVTLSDDEDNVSHDVDSLLHEAMTSCPAFESGSCPFKNAKNTDQVRHVLLDVPPSHLEEKGHFYRALRHLHHVSQTLEEQDEKFNIPGGCPVQSYSPDASFAGAMEEYSLASIMARMAQDVMEKEHEETEKETLVEPKVTRIAPSLDNQTAPSNAESSHQVRLSEALKSGTAESHQAAESVHFVKNFIKGIIDRKLYGELVLSLYHVYDQLEESLNQYAPQYFSSCHFPRELSRKEALEEDVDFWHGSPLPDHISPATQDYVNRIQFLANHDPLMLLAHSYTRYLGDLSGGKILARVARKAMQLGTDGLDFYEFDNIESAKLFKDEYRSALDNLHLTPTQVSKLVAEANVAFVLNMRLFEELDVMANIEGAQVRDLSEALAFADSTRIAAHGHGGKKEDCPFAKMSGEAKNLESKSTPTVATTHRQVPWPLVTGLVLCFLWWTVQTYYNVDAADTKQNSIAHTFLEPFQEWDGRGPWI